MALIEKGCQVARKLRAWLSLPNEIRRLFDLQLFESTRALQKSHPNPINRCGKKCFSQFDEDGITLEIVRRLGLTADASYAEFGVGDGSENNTLILAACGWKGFWVGGETLIYSSTSRPQSRKTIQRIFRIDTALSP